MGRTGKLFAYEHFDMVPDIMTLAKALANGLPMGAMLAKSPVFKAFGPGSHATTFGGTPLVASAAIAVVRTLLDDGVIENCQKVGRYFRKKLLGLKSKYAFIREVRGKGLLIGLDLACDGAVFVKGCLNKGFLINCTQEHVLRFIPPLIIGERDIDALIACLDGLFAEFSEDSAKNG